MCFLSNNFGCKIIFMRSINFWHQQDSYLLVTWPLSASGLFHVRPCTPWTTVQGICYLVIPGTGVLANFVLHRVRQFCQPQGHAWAFGIHMHSYPNIFTKHGGFYWKHQQIQRLAYLSGTGKTFRGFLRYCNCLLNFMSAFLHWFISRN